MKLCDFYGCDRPMCAKGLCTSHYAQSKVGKDLHPIGAYTGWDLEAMLTECEEKEDCLIFRPHTKRKYSLVMINRKAYDAHRAVYQMWTGEDIEGIPIHHKCGRSKCINPEHLQKASKAENTLEMLGRKAYEAEIARLKAENAELRALLGMVQEVA